MNTRAASRVRGFSLVEVCLAMLVVGLGLLSIFGLFPTGIAASEDAQVDTATGLFANRILTQLQVQADNVKPFASDPSTIAQAWKDWRANTFTSSGLDVGLLAEEVAYVLTIVDRGDRIKEVTMQAMVWKGNTFPSADVFNANKVVFYTELYFTVLP